MNFLICGINGTLVCFTISFMSKAVEGEKSKDHLGCLKEAVFLSLLKTGEIQCLGSSLILAGWFPVGIFSMGFSDPFHLKCSSDNHTAWWILRK